MIKKNSVHICCPIYDRPHRAFFEAILSIMTDQHTPIPRIFKPAWKCPSPHKGRNLLASHFLKGPCEYMFMTDCDMEPTMPLIERLVLRGAPVVGALYRSTYEPHHFVLNTLEGQFDPSAAPLQEVKFVGTGAMLIHRSVFEAMIAGLPEIAYTTDTNEGKQPAWGFFSTGIVDGRDLSCDWAFCQRWRDLGGKVLIDCVDVVPHWDGSHKF